MESSEYKRILQTIDEMPKDQWSNEDRFKRISALIKLSRFKEAKEEIYLLTKSCTDPVDRDRLYELLSDISEQTTPKAKISKLCLAGFIMSSLGAVSFFGFVFLGAYHVESYVVELAVTFFIAVELLIAFIVSVKGVVSASLNRYRFRFLGVFGILLSGIPLTIAMHYLPLLIFHESPPSPPPTYSQTG